MRIAHGQHPAILVPRKMHPFFPWGNKKTYRDHDKGNVSTMLNVWFCILSALGHHVGVEAVVGLECLTCGIEVPGVIPTLFQKLLGSAMPFAPQKDPLSLKRFSQGFSAWCQYDNKNECYIQKWCIQKRSESNTEMHPTQVVCHTNSATGGRDPRSFPHLVRSWQSRRVRRGFHCWNDKSWRLLATET